MARRAAIVAGVIALLTSGLAAADSGIARAPRPDQRRTEPMANNQAEAKAGLGDGALVFGDDGGPLVFGDKATPGPDSLAAPAVVGNWALSGANGAALATGIRLLGQAATATSQTSYQGMQIMSWLTPEGSGAWLGSGGSAMKVAVWHPGGLGTLTRMTATATGQTYVTDDPDGQPSDGVLGLTPALLSLLAAHYAIVYTGKGSVGGRQASVVDALRADGTLAARFWLDNATKLPLCREIFDSRARLVSQDDLATLTVGAASGMPVVTSSRAVSQPWTDRLHAAQLTALRGAGWPVPASEPGGLTLFDASESTTTTGKVVDLGYSDGLSDVSLFVQRGQLPGALPGWSQTSLDGHPLFVRNPGEPDVAWSAGGFAFTLVADAPAPVVASVVNALPHQPRPGFWGRMGHGVRRLLSWANPFR